MIVDRLLNYDKEYYLDNFHFQQFSAKDFYYFENF